MTKSLSFTEENIHRLFGHEAAENEDPSRLRDYYFKNRVYERIATSSAVRVLVGHKGIGKSALFKVAMLDDEEQGRLAISIKPDDVLEMPFADDDFNMMVRQWKDGIRRIVLDKTTAKFAVSEALIQSGAAKRIGGFLIGLKATLQQAIASKINLQPVQRTLLTRFLQSGSVVVYLDDLDRGWTNSQRDIRRLSALLNAVRDMSSDENGLYFRIALRSDVYFLVRTSDESTDKIEGSVIWFSWTNHEILAMLAKRVGTFFGQKLKDEQLIAQDQPTLASILDPILSPRFQGRGKWNNAQTYRILMSVIRRRPRDLVKLMTLAARSAEDRSSSIIDTIDLQRVFAEYSQGRIQDTVNEYRSELPEIERVLLEMKPSKQEKQRGQEYVFTTDRLVAKLIKVIDHVHPRYSNGREADPHSLAAFLYKINFLNARKELPSTYIDRKYFDENRYLAGHFADFGYDWEIHPAYWWALQPEKPQDTFEALGLSN